MITIPVGRMIGIATTPDLSDMNYEPARASLQVNLKDRIQIVPHPDGTDLLVFPLHGLFIAIKSSIVLG